jgi:hypothetical protein
VVEIRHTLLAATMLTVMSAKTLVAGEYLVEVSGAEGIVFGGTCFLITAGNGTNYAASGSTPLTLKFFGELISCAIQRKAGSGDLHIVIKNSVGDVVAESSRTLPFGVIIAGGR